MRLSIGRRNHRTIGLIPVLVVLVLISAQSLVAEIVVVAIGDSITYGGTGWTLQGSLGVTLGRIRQQTNLKILD